MYMDLARSLQYEDYPPVGELVDPLALGASVERRAGSIPAGRTKKFED